MKHFTAVALVALSAALSCARTEPVPFSVIPQPNQVTLGEGSFKLAGAAFGTDEAIPAETAALIDEFRVQIGIVTGKESAAVSGASEKGVSFVMDNTLGAEAYALRINPDGVQVSAADYNGFLYAIQTLKQMLPAAVYGDKKAPGPWLLQTADILDQPRFGYRGILLDCCRHFWSIEETKKIIDIMSIHKLNRLHWHLTEDQGWRIESKKYPKLNEIGSWREGTQVGYERDSTDGVRYGGYYTQDQLREVVAYAAKKGITVIPEIDLPGHMVAAVASYPELGCTGGPYEVRKSWGISKDILCVGKESTFKFLEDVFDEILDIFPSEYINIGGDEAPKDRWQECPLCQKKIRQLGLKDRDGHTKEQFLQNYVTKRMQDYLAGKGRKIIGWDEILEGELAPGATVMSWRGTKGGITAAGKGFDVIMSPNIYLYIDYYNSKEFDREPIGIGRRALPVETTYNYEPYDEMPQGSESHIIGVQANLWTEYISTPEHLEYNLLPRMSAASEIQWCRADNKDFDRFKASMEHMRTIYDQLGYTYSKYMWGIVGLPGHEQPARSQEALDTINLKTIEKTTYE